jgi:magnesium chelatase subunit D
VHDETHNVIELRCADAALAAAIFAAGPSTIGGVVARTEAGPVQECWLESLKSLLPAGGPVRRLPTHITDDRLLGGLDLAATLSVGRPVADRGLLAEANGGILVIPGSDRLSAAIAGRIVSVLDLNEVTLERDGLTRRLPASFGIVALDEGRLDEDRAPSSLRDRLALHIDLQGLRLTEFLADLFVREDIERASHEHPAVSLSHDVIAALCEAAAMLGVASLNAPILAVRVARIAAALDRRAIVSADDAATATRLVLAPRATRLPDAADETPPEQEPKLPNPDDVEKPAEPEGKALRDMLVAAARAALPPQLLALLKSKKSGRSRASSAGKSGARQKSPRRGRPVGVSRSESRDGQRLNIVETLRAAAPWQSVRRRERSLAEVPAKRRLVHVKPDDFRFRRLKYRAETTTIFIVDASGSTAVQRLAEAKGAVELLLADCYSRRDTVALIAFSGRGTETLLPPTRALARAKRNLADLPGGGGTPLASGIAAAGLLGEAVRRKGQTPGIVLLTDGRANISQDGTPGRARAEEEAVSAAHKLRASRTAAILIDTSTKPQFHAARIAEAMGATYIPLPHADARTLSDAIKAQMDRRAP